MQSVRLTTAKFIAFSREVHGDRYDYSLCEYKTAKNKVQIICRSHGAYWTLPGNHRAGKNCPMCAAESRGARSRMTTHVFIKRAKSVHGDRYDYDGVKYTTQKEKVDIRCRHHGVFRMLPGNHTSGQGCPICAQDKGPNTKSNTREFVYKARSLHSDTYSYEQSIYVDSKTPVTIKCWTHGEFQQTPSSHLSGRGCQKCGTKKPSASKKLSNEDFIARAKAVHGDKYDYSLAKYNGRSGQVKIICPTHGEFTQLAGNHLSGKGCYKCNRTGPKFRTTAEFISLAIGKHGDKYDYSKVDYKSGRSAVTIVCLAHGEFNQTPSDHLAGCGCPRCYDQFNQPCAIYVFSSESNGTKIGISQNPSYRLAKVSKGMDFDANLYSFITASDWFAARSIESSIHKQLADLNCGYTGFDGATEWFNIDPKEAFDLVRDAVAATGAIATNIIYNS